MNQGADHRRLGRALPLGERRVKEIVHYACPKDPEGELILEDGRKVALSIGDMELAVNGEVRLSMKEDGDMSYIVRYSGAALHDAAFFVNFDAPNWQDEFNADLDEWIAGGYAGDLGYVVDVCVTARST